MVSIDANLSPPPGFNSQTVIFMVRYITVLGRQPRHAQIYILDLADAFVRRTHPEKVALTETCKSDEVPVLQIYFYNNAYLKSKINKTTYNKSQYCVLLGDKKGTIIIEGNKKPLRSLKKKNTWFEYRWILFYPQNLL